MDLGEPVSEQTQLPDEALKSMLVKREPIPPAELSRAVRFMAEEILKFRLQRNICTQKDLEEAVEIQIGRFSGRRERRDPISSYPNRINLDAEHTTVISREHLTLRFDYSGITVTNHSSNNSFLDGQKVPPNSFLINEESTHQAQLRPKAAPFTLSLRDYRQAVDAEINGLKARQVQVSPAITE